MQSTLCDICESELDDPIQFGNFMTKSGIRVHYYCLLLSTNLAQKGEDSSGILGFLIPDIKKEIKSAALRNCHYCAKKNASIKCDKCAAYFHIFCGLKNDCLFQFFDYFKSFCHEHHGIVHQKTHCFEEGCYVCVDTMGPYNPLTSITARCCSERFWVHRKCLQKYALVAGYYLSCLWCRNPQFRDDVRLLGVFVPDRDAEWEREKGAFKNLYKTHARCDAKDCRSTRGQDFKGSGKWRILLCYSCGISGIHLACCTESSHLSGTSFQCSTCSDIFNRTVQLRDKTLFMSKSQIVQDAAENIKKSASTLVISPPDGAPLDMLDKTLFMSKSQMAHDAPQYIEVYPINASPQDEAALDKIPSPNKILDAQDSNVLAYALVNADDNSIIKLGGSRDELLSSTLDSGTQHDVGACGFDLASIELIHKLVAQLPKQHLLHEEVIDVSDDDNDTQSVEELLERMVLKSTAPVPKPCEK